MPDARVLLGDCREVLPTLPAASFDCVLCDPPYPCIKRSYGTWTEAEWFKLMRAVVPECMRVLKPSGSAVFILQPNSERVGRMRTWLWEFMTWVGKEWGIVQDAWWWNIGTLPLGGACRYGLMRSSLKACVWVGSANCYRNQSAVLKPEAAHTANERKNGRFLRENEPSRQRSATEGPRDSGYRLLTRCAERGGATPFNVLPIGSDGRWNGGTHGHGASTPLRLADWWLRYLCPQQGVVLDPFAGSGTVLLAAMKQDKSAVGIETKADYCDITNRRLAAERAKTPLFAGAER